jgi:hypothetical protein
MVVHKPLVLDDGQVQRLPDGDSIETGQPNIGNAENIFVTSPSITISATHIILDATSNQNLDFINGGTTNDVIFVRGTVGMSKVTVRDAGNVLVPLNRKIESPATVLQLLNIGLDLWVEVSWSG